MVTTLDGLSFSHPATTPSGQPAFAIDFRVHMVAKGGELYFEVSRPLLNLNAIWGGIRPLEP